MDKTEASNEDANSVELMITFQKARANVESRGAAQIDLVFILNALLDDTAVVNAMKTKGIDCNTLRFYLEKHLDDRKYPEEISEKGTAISEILDSALRQLIMKTSLQKATNVDLLNAIWNVTPTPAREYYAVSAIDLCLTQDNETIRGCTRANFVFESFAPNAIPQSDDPTIAKTDKNANVRIFKDVEFCTNLTYLAFQGKIDPVFGRDPEVENMMQVITLRKKSNPILLGEPGVGKTAVVEALAVRIIADAVPEQLRGSEIVALDIARFIAGTRQRGDFEQRISNLVDTLETNPNIILFVDEIHTLVGGTLGASDAAELLKPALSGGRIKVIGATTHGEYLKYFGKNPAMARRFQPITIAEPDVEQAIKIIDKVIPTYKNHHNLEYCDTAAKLAVELSKSFIVDKQLPDKAIDVIDRAGSLAKTEGRASVEEADIFSVVQTMSGIKISSNEKFVENVLEDLQQRILGQDAACKTIAKALARANSGFSREDRAKSSILLYGPDASGKRHAARQIATILNTKMIRLDMSEFSEPHTTSRLVGSPPGYVGYGEGGQLSEAVRRNPSCVIFLDRIDLAHPNVRGIIMQAIDNGLITDSMGNLVSFTGVTVILSVVHENVKKTIGFSSSAANDDERPENLPRDLVDAVDVIVEFKTMPEDALLTVAEKHVTDFMDRLTKKDVRISLPNDIASKLASSAKDDGGNAKAVERAFKKLIEDPVLDALPQRGQHISVSINGKDTVVDRLAS